MLVGDGYYKVVSIVTLKNLPFQNMQAHSGGQKIGYICSPKMRDLQCIYAAG